MQIAQRVAQQISSASDILVICHVSPDGDAIGSLLGLGLALRATDKRVTLACGDPVPENCRHLPGWQTIVSADDPDAAHVIYRNPSTFDLIISLDCSDLDRLGAPYDSALFKGIPIVNIDHHRTNVEFGALNWVDPQAASTSQLVVHLIRALDIPWTPEIATCLLNGILTDTLGFRTSSTSTQVLETAVEMMDAGASLTSLTDRIFNHRPLGTIQMWSSALQNLHLVDRILWSEITQDMRQRTGYMGDGDAGLVNFLNTADEADVAVIFDELRDGHVNVSFRSTAGIDVSEVALALGGGGHAQAAGCTLPGPLEHARETVLGMLRQAMQAHPSQD